jgi:TolB protein
LLNVGAAVTPSAGTDVMTNLYRMMAVGTTRVYVKPDGPLTLDSYLAALKAGRSFVSTGPLLRFSTQGAGPGGVITAKPGTEVTWEADVASPIAFETIEVLVNGTVAWSDKGLTGPGTRKWSGKLKAPAGGWIAARIRGGAITWPAMDSYPFAHTGAAWFGSVGSIDRSAARVSANELLKWLDVAEKRLDEGFAGAQIPNLKARFTDARRKLETIASAGTARASQ